VSLARKCWKKRRRSGSPLLVPCSILNVDRKSALLWNVLYLLQKFGHSASNNKSKKNEITLSLTELGQRHSTHLKFNLKHAAMNMGFDSVQDLIADVVNKRVQESYGIQLIKNEHENDENDDWYLRAPISRFRAQQRAAQAAILQFVSSSNSNDSVIDMKTTMTSSDSNNNDDNDENKENDNETSPNSSFHHTGMVRNKRTEKNMLNMDDDDKSSASNNNNNNNLYMLQPLSAALRVSRDDLDSGLVQNDSLHAAVVLEYDLHGDNGAPLLVVSLNPRQGQVRDSLKFLSSSSSTTTASSSSSSNNAGGVSGNSKIIRMMNSNMPIQYLVQDLRVGTGPLRAKVIRLVRGGALVDCGVGRKNGVGDTNDAVPVLGFLRFKDAVRVHAAAAATATTTTTRVLDSEDGNDDEDDEFQDDAPWKDILSFDDFDEDNEEEDDDEYRDKSTSRTTSKSSSSSSRKSARVEEEDLDLSALLLEGDDDDDDNVEKEGGVINTEDVTHLFQQNEDGSYTYTDPDTGYSQVILNDDFGKDGDEDEDDEDADEDTVRNDLFISKPPPLTATTTAKLSTQSRRRGTAGSTTASSSSSSSSREFLQRKLLKVGESIDVYILSASKQSQQIKVTMNANDVYGKSARDLKKRDAVNKRLGRLAKQLGFKHDGSIVDNVSSIPTNKSSDDDDSAFSLHRAMEYWKGREMNGIVKATSQTGDWLYVQPQPDANNNAKSNGRRQRRSGGFLPVGVASIHVETTKSGSNDDASATAAAPSREMPEFRQGDPVRIRIQGIDKERGQLSLRLLHKLAP
jgi:hypothetical protein